MMFALIDCNNFYASCERLFRPDLKEKPIVVLSNEEIKKKDKLMSLFDTINARFGSHTIKLAAEGYSKPWAMKSQMCSPCYTTRWSELPVVYSRD